MVGRFYKRFDEKVNHISNRPKQTSAEQCSRTGGRCVIGSWLKSSRVVPDKDVADGSESSERVVGSGSGVGGFGSADEAAPVWE